MVFTLQDISEEERRQALERIFLHDLSNVLHGLRGWAELLQLQAKSPKEVAEHVVALSEQVLAEVRHQDLLVRAEQGRLVPVWTEVEVGKLCEELRQALVRSRSVQGRTLRIEDPGTLRWRTDPILVARVLLNMLLNALEATPEGGTVRIRARMEAEALVFAVHNPTMIPPEVQGSLFKRAFSTKASHGRGLGTYSMKLLGEAILGGQVSFETDAVRGTTFFFRLPAPKDGPLV